MNVLYSGKYKQRFSRVIDKLNHLPASSSVLELCFGDIYIADFCKMAGHRWIGLDINRHFVDKARKLGFDAKYADLASMENLPDADVCIMMGSFYHFHPHSDRMLARMFSAADTVIISEPISNLSDMKGWIGFFARRAANAGKGNEKFRYNKLTFMAMLKENSERLNFAIASVENPGKDMIVKLIKNERS